MTRSRNVATYLPEDFYFRTNKQSPVNASLITAKCVVRWADRYEAFAPRAAEKREQAISGSRSKRERMIQDLFDWFAQSGEPVERSRLILSRGQVWLFDAHEGLPAIRLSLTADQFAHLQRCWASNDLPADLYYSADQRVTSVETIERYGGIVRLAKRFSPLEWAHRKSTPPRLPVPTEDERARQFMDACEQFARATMLRRLQLTEPGREVDLYLVRSLDRLRAEVMAARGRARQALRSTQSIDELDHGNENLTEP